MMTAKNPILYSFRRCPYAMRARMGLVAARQKCRLREVVLRDKPAEMLAISPKATVPVLQLGDGTVIEESLDIMDWALSRHDPDAWLGDDSAARDKANALIDECDSAFKHHLDRYKYANRYEGADALFHRREGRRFLEKLNGLLSRNAHLFGASPTLADFAIFPFVRQFANTDRAWFDAENLPTLQAWLEAHLESQLFKTIMKKYPPWKPGDEEVMFVV